MTLAREKRDDCSLPGPHSCTAESLWMTGLSVVLSARFNLSVCLHVSSVTGTNSELSNASESEEVADRERDARPRGVERGGGGGDERGARRGGRGRGTSTGRGRGGAGPRQNNSISSGEEDESGQAHSHTHTHTHTCIYIYRHTDTQTQHTDIAH